MGSITWHVISKFSQQWTSMKPFVDHAKFADLSAFVLHSRQNRWFLRLSMHYFNVALDDQ